MADRYQAWIEGAAAERPQLAAALAELGELYHKKLWHQLTAKLEQHIEVGASMRGVPSVVHRAVLQATVGRCAAMVGPLASHCVPLLCLGLFHCSSARHRQSPSCRSFG